MGPRKIDPKFNIHEIYTTVNIINPYRFEGGGAPAPTLEPETLAYIDRVQTDGGVVVDEAYTNNVFAKLKELGILGNLVHWSGAKVGLKKSGTGEVNKIYSLVTSTDAQQLTAARQGVWNASSPPNNVGTPSVYGDGDMLYLIPAATYTNITINHWLKYSSAANKVIFERSTNNGSYRNHVTNGFQADVEFGVNSNTADRVFSEKLLNNNVLHYISSTYDGTTSRIYTNGSLTQSKAVVATHTSDAFFQYGSRNGASGVVGDYNHLSVFNIALSDFQINELKALG